MQIFADVSSNVVSGLIGAFLVWCLTVLIQYISQRRVHRQFPIAGRYITRYEDEVDGARVVQKAVADITQNGFQLKGTTTNFSENRTWHFRLTIEKSRFIHGVYGPNDPRDSSTGVIFLELQPNGSLEGIWSGHDSRNQRVEGGKYWFVRAIDFNIVPLTRGEHDIRQALDILRSNLGERYVSHEDLEKYISDGNAAVIKRIALVAKNRKNQEIIGVLLVEVVTNDRLEASLLESYQSIRHEPYMYQLRNQTTGLIKSIAVDSQARGSGVATELVKTAMQDLNRRGVKSFYSIGWVTEEKGCHVQGVLESLGFECVQKFERFWYTDSRKNGYDCPTCGHPCKCSALLFVTD